MDNHQDLNATIFTRTGTILTGLPLARQYVYLLLLNDPTIKDNVVYRNETTLEEFKARCNILLLSDVLVTSYYADIDTIVGYNNDNDAVIFNVRMTNINTNESFLLFDNDITLERNNDYAIDIKYSNTQKQRSFKATNQRILNIRSQVDFSIPFYIIPTSTTLSKLTNSETYAAEVNRTSITIPKNIVIGDIVDTRIDRIDYYNNIVYFKEDTVFTGTTYISIEVLSNAIPIRNITYKKSESSFIIEDADVYYAIIDYSGIDNIINGQSYILHYRD